MRYGVQNTIITIIGHKGFGKTKLTEILSLINRRPTIIVDPRYQFEPKPWRLHFRSFGTFRKWFLTPGNIAAFYTYKPEIVINGLDDFDDFNELCGIILKMKKITFVVDEVDMFAPTTMNNKANFYKLIHYGRHAEIDIITTSRRPANISRNLTSQTDIAFFAKVKEPADKKYITDYIGKEYLRVAEKLPQFSFLMVDNTAEKAKIIDIPKAAAKEI